MALTQSLVTRNEMLIREHLMKQINPSLEVGAEALEEEIRGASLLIKPLIKSIYDTVVRNELRNSTIRIINGLLKMCKRMIEDGVEEGSPEFYKRLEEKFPGYLKVEATGKQCKPNHRNFPILKDNLKKTFEWQVRPVLRLLQVEEPANTYADLCRAAYTKEELRKVLHNQIECMRYGIEIIDKDPSILKIPAGRDLFIRVLKKGFDRKVKDFDRDIEEFYKY